jgi:hypothetical protein
MWFGRWKVEILFAKVRKNITLITFIMRLRRIGRHGGRLWLGEVRVGRLDFRDLEWECESLGAGDPTFKGCI